MVARRRRKSDLRGRRLETGCSTPTYTQVGSAPAGPVLPFRPLRPYEGGSSRKSTVV
jgi:hypothetical protein